MMADLDYSGTTKPLERAQRDEALLQSVGYFDAEEAEKIANLRRKWLLAEKAFLAEHRVKLASEPRTVCTRLGCELFNGRADTSSATGRGSLAINKDGGNHNFQCVNPRRSVLQRLNLFVRHALTLLQLRKPKRVVDSAQAKPEKDAA